uniref:Uncharacterized protein n=1 Tax=Myotis myotis TaxID=51298 RepID=A0A7J7ZYA2_MYOMY|nr:hypothetical protein mMyoMyo1_009945 [Myotis myotis]
MAGLGALWSLAGALDKGTCFQSTMKESCVFPQLLGFSVTQFPCVKIEFVPFSISPIGYSRRSIIGLSLLSSLMMQDRPITYRIAVCVCVCVCVCVFGGGCFLWTREIYTGRPASFLVLNSL